MNNEEKILEMLGTLTSEIKSMKQEQQETNKRLDKLEQAQQETHALATETHALATETHTLATETHNNLIVLENTLVPKVNAIYETRMDLVPRVEKLETTVEKLQFGKEVIKLVALIEQKQNN